MNATAKSRKAVLLLWVALLALLQTHALGQITNSTWVGQPGDNWSDFTKWNPTVVPRNHPIRAFNVFAGMGSEYPGIALDIDVTLNSLTLTDEASAITSTDHNFASTSTSMALNFQNEQFGGGIFQLGAVHRSVTANLGNLADFSGATLNSGNLIAVTEGADRGITSTIQFNGANIRTNNGDLQLGGPGTALVDEHGQDALTHFQHNTVNGVVLLEAGRTFTTEGAFVNEGSFQVHSEFQGAAGLTTFTINGNLTMATADGEGVIESFSNGTGMDSLVTVKGVITDYDPATKTLNGGIYDFLSANGSVSTVKVLGGTPIDIVNNNAFIDLFGPNTGIRDSSGADAIRNLKKTNNFFRMADRDFTTAGALVNTAVLSIRGDSHFTVSGDLTIESGIFHVSEEPGYAFYDFLGDLPTDPRYLDSRTNVNGNLTLAKDANLRFDIWPSDSTATINATGDALLAGELRVFLMGDTDGASGNSRTLLTARSFKGAFSNVPSGGRVLAYSEPRIRLQSFGGTIVGSYKATYSGTSLLLSDFQPHASMQNISTRLKVQTNDNVSIAGFIVRGAGPKQVLVRGLGPSLAAKGVPGVLPDPTMELHDSTGATLMSNNDWQQTQADDIRATGLAPTDPHESAILASLDPGTYTAILSGVNNTSGIGLIEVYDLDGDPAASEFANISTRGRVGINDDVMIGGYIVGTGNPANLIVRAIGPSLASTGVAGSLQDPTLELHDASGALLMSDDNWQNNSSQAALIQSAGLAPIDARESALAVSLTPGNYTAIVRGENNTQGVALVEFYKLN